jgi:hypothetical protein
MASGCAVFLIIAASLVYFLMRDLGLPLSITSVRLPDVIVENIDFRREIDGREWHVVARTAEHDSGRIRADSLRVHVSEPEAGRSAELEAVSGEFTQDGGDVLLYSLEGVVVTPDRSIDVIAPRAFYGGSEKIWTLDGGVTLRDGSSYMKGGSARIDPDGVVSIDKGVEARWRIEY